MKKLMTTMLMVLTAFGAFSQNNSQLHIFCNDDNFATHKGSNIAEIAFGDNNMTVSDTNGKKHIYPMTAVDSCVVRTVGIPEIYVTLHDYPQWTELEGRKDDVHEATLYMEGNGMFEDLEGQTVEFRGRGNSTWDMPKKPYRFKMSKKKSVCGLPKAKTFALLANFIDGSMLRNAVAMWIGQYLGMPFTNHIIPVKVYLNGNYKGVYTITEKIGIGGGSVDIEENTGMLFELDTNYDEKYKFRYTWENGTEYIAVMVKDPDLDELAADQTVTTITDASAYFELWKADFSKMADAITSRKSTESLSDVLDIESAANYLLVYNLCRNKELSHPKSVYMYKTELGDNEVYHFGPIWDWAFTFDETEGEAPDAPMLVKKNKANGYSFFKLLASNGEVLSLFKQKLDDFAINGYPELIKYIDQYTTMLEPAAKENGLLWPTKRYPNSYSITGSFDYRTNVDTLKKWLDDRLNYILNDTNYGLY